MSYDLMIIASRKVMNNYDTGSCAVAITSEVKSFPNKLQADAVHAAMDSQDQELDNHTVFAVKLYTDDLVY